MYGFNVNGTPPKIAKRDSHALIVLQILFLFTSTYESGWSVLYLTAYPSYQHYNRNRRLQLSKSLL